MTATQTEQPLHAQLIALRAELAMKRFEMRQSDSDAAWDRESIEVARLEEQERAVVRLMDDEIKTHGLMAIGYQAGAHQAATLGEQSRCQSESVRHTDLAATKRLLIGGA
jgi:hypothetical protein